MGIIEKHKKVKKKGIKHIVLSRVQRMWDKKRNLEPIKKYHIVSAEQLQVQKDTFFLIQPKISIITPLYNTNTKYLKELILSVQNQTYQNWELCLADGSTSEYESVGKVVEMFAMSDDRIIYKKLDQNEGIVGNTNQCIKLASGEYYGLLDHDDILHPSALYEIVKEIQNGADFIYTDEMKFRKNFTKETDIVCKSGFGKYELRSHNYICHFVVFNKSLIEGWERLYRKEFEGSQDYDMVLRLTETANHIVHIPKILYYWRVHSQSVSFDVSVKQYAVDAAKGAIESQLTRQGEIGSVECNYPYQTIYRVAYPIKCDAKVSIVMLGECDLPELRINQIIQGTHYSNIEIIVNQQLSIQLDNVVYIKYKSDKMQYDWLNYAVDHCSGAYVVFFDWKCVPRNENWIEEMLMYAQKEDVCAVGGHILHDKNKTYYAGACLDSSSNNKMYFLDYNQLYDSTGYEANKVHVRNTTIVPSFCMMISKKTFTMLHGFNCIYNEYSDVDLCLRGLEKQLCNVWTCYATIDYGGAEAISNQWKENQTFFDAWNEVVEREDPYLHPLLKQLKMV